MYTRTVQRRTIRTSSRTHKYRTSTNINLFPPAVPIADLQIMLWGVLVATVQSRRFFVAYPVSFLLRYLYIRPISRASVVCPSVRRSQGVVARRHESSRVLFVTLSKSETYKETIVRVLVPQSLVLIAKLIIVLVLYGIADYMLCGGLVATPRSRDFVVKYPV